MIFNSYAKRYTVKLLTCIVCTIQVLSLASSIDYAYSQSFQLPSIVQSVDIFNDVGEISAQYVSKSEKAVSLILIQDAHANYEVQQRIEKIIDRLHSRCNANSIFVEGISGALDISLFRAFPFHELKKKIYAQYLKEGIVSGPEHYAITNDKNVDLIGVDDDDMYMKNVHSYANCLTLQKKADAIMEKIEAYVTNIASQRMNSSLKQYCDLFYLKNTGQISSLEEIERFIHFLNDQNIVIAQSKYSTLFTYQKVIACQKSINMEALVTETQSLIQKKLLPKMSDTEIENLAIVESNIEKEENSLQDFYEMLKKICIVYKVDLKHFPHLYRYYQILRLAASLDARAFVNEQKLLNAEVTKQLTLSREDEVLLRWYKGIYLAKKMIKLKAQADEVHTFRNIEHLFSKKSLKDLSFEMGVALPEQLNSVSFSFIKPYVGFYLLAEKRDELLIENTLNKLAEQKNDMGILVVGGYHTSGITRYLREADISYVVITPKITNIDKRYEQIMKDRHVNSMIQDSVLSGTVKELTSLNPIINKNLYGQLLADLVQHLHRHIDDLLQEFVVEEIPVKDIKRRFSGEKKEIVDALLKANKLPEKISKNKINTLVAAIWNAAVREKIVLFDSKDERFRILDSAIITDVEKGLNPQDIRDADEIIHGPAAVEDIRSILRIVDLLYIEGAVSFDYLQQAYRKRKANIPLLPLERILKDGDKNDVFFIYEKMQEYGYSIFESDMSVIEQVIKAHERRDAVVKGLAPSEIPMRSEVLASIRIDHQVVKDIQKSEVLYVTPELGGLAQTGGLGIVSLEGVYWTEQVLSRTGRHIVRILPFFKWTQNPASKGQHINYREKGWSLYRVHDSENNPLEFFIRINGIAYPTRIIIGYQEKDGIWNIMLDNEILSEYPYKSLNPNDWAKTQAVWFSQATLKAMQYLELKTQIIHIMDWQTGLIPEYLDTDEFQSLNNQVSVIAAVHNARFHGRGGRDSYAMTGLPWDRYTFDRLEMHGDWSTLKGFQQADYVYTVSKTHAEELQDDNKEGAFGLQGMFRHLANQGRFGGIVNGIDYRQWGFASGENKESYRAKMQAMLEKEKKQLILDPTKPLLITTSRLSAQKGMNLVQKILPRLIEEYDVQFIQVGTTAGNRENDPNGNALADRFRDLEHEYPENVAAFLSFNMPMCQTAFGAADIVLDPTYFEPCGLNYMFAMRYGTLSVGRAVGGLVDVIVDYESNHEQANGFLFYSESNDEEILARQFFAKTVEAIKLNRENPEIWQRLKENAYNTDSSWETRVESVIRMYERLGMRKKRSSSMTLKDSLINSLAKEIGLSLPIMLSDSDQIHDGNLVEDTYAAYLQKKHLSYSRRTAIAYEYMRTCFDFSEGEEKQNTLRVLVEALERGSLFYTELYNEKKTNKNKALAFSYSYFENLKDEEYDSFKKIFMDSIYNSAIIFVDIHITQQYEDIRRHIQNRLGVGRVHIIPIKISDLSMGYASFDVLGYEIFKGYDIVTVLNNTFDIQEAYQSRLGTYVREAWEHGSHDIKNKFRLIGGTGKEVMRICKIMAFIDKWINSQGELSQDARNKLGFFLLDKTALRVFESNASNGVIKAGVLEEHIYNSFDIEKRTAIIRRFA